MLLSSPLKGIKLSNIMHLDTCTSAKQNLFGRGATTCVLKFDAP